MSNGQVHLTVKDGIAAILIDRPEARNAMTWAMYDEVMNICSRLVGDLSIKAATFRGAGGEAFVAGTDIEQFRAFGSGDDGVDYEKVIDERIGGIERLPFPTIAITEGWVIGGGLAIAMACDFRLATSTAVFGVPIARTLGNCLSVANVARLVAAFGAARAKKMLLLGETVNAAEAASCGFVLDIAEAGELEAKADALCARLARNAPLTMRASKEAIRRVVGEGLPDGEDLIRSCYGSRDFQLGVEAFLEKKKPVWSGT